MIYSSFHFFQFLARHCSATSYSHCQNVFYSFITSSTIFLILFFFVDVVASAYGSLRLLFFMWAMFRCRRCQRASHSLPLSLSPNSILTLCAAIEVNACMHGPTTRVLPCKKPRVAVSWSSEYIFIFFSFFRCENHFFRRRRRCFVREWENNWDLSHCWLPSSVGPSPHNATHTLTSVGFIFGNKLKWANGRVERKFQFRKEPNRKKDQRNAIKRSVKYISFA